MIVAWGADIDYIWPTVHPSTHNGLRITHSLAASFLLPALTGVWLWKFPPSWLSTDITNDMTKRFLFIQVLGVSISHPLLDILVGVTPLPLLYPFSLETFRLPFGILPSAGKIDVMNYYFWQNLYLELGVLLPLLLAWCLSTWCSSRFRPGGFTTQILEGVKWGAIAFCIALSSTFIHQCYGLPRP